MRLQLCLMARKQAWRESREKRIVVSLCTHCSVCISDWCHARRRCLFFQPLRCRKLLKSFQVVPALVLWMSKSQACSLVALDQSLCPSTASRWHRAPYRMARMWAEAIRLVVSIAIEEKTLFLDRPSCNPAVGSFANDQALTGRNQPIQGQPCLSDQGRAVARVVDATLFQRRHSPRLRNRTDEIPRPIWSICGSARWSLTG